MDLGQVLYSNRYCQVVRDVDILFIFCSFLWKFGLFLRSSDHDCWIEQLNEFYVLWYQFWVFFCWAFVVWSLDFMLLFPEQLLFCGLGWWRSPTNFTWGNWLPCETLSLLCLTFHWVCCSCFRIQIILEHFHLCGCWFYTFIYYTSYQPFFLCHFTL